MDRTLTLRGCIGSFRTSDKHIFRQLNREEAAAIRNQAKRAC